MTCGSGDAVPTEDGRERGRELRLVGIKGEDVVGGTEQAVGGEGLHVANERNLRTVWRTARAAKEDGRERRAYAHPAGFRLALAS